MASLTLAALTLTYPNGTRAVDGVDLEIEDGAFLAILGPSGCGKSSLLRLIAGLETPGAGEIRMDGHDVTRLAPKDRDVAMVFQGLALYPHMTVAENMSLGLRARKTPAAEVDRRVREAAETLGLSRYLGKRPRELSGGERQRVALGRALVRRPKLYLFDEPLSSLDAQLRQELREELARLHRLTRTTSIYVTHDQKEALSLGDRVAVMRAGQVRQLASPEVIYRDPRDLFVARFVGEPPINLIEGEIEDGAAGAVFLARGWRFTLGGKAPRVRPGTALLGIRPECVLIADQGEIPAVVERVEHLGGESLLHAGGEWGRVVVRLAPSARAPEPGARVLLRPDPSRAVLFDPATGERLA
ncbi:MAG TPA: ABC transporter ATP-binding protein [Candidatus Limnocylindrales bacterium]|nr:ABC transporter ATP-binding protein [Candidatus Limnocylindrales bacterium]